jgi:MOSC domain-containing protein YiiM
MKGTVVSVNRSDKKGTAKTPTDALQLVVDLGVAGDAHSAPGDRQVSLLMIESIDRARAGAECQLNEGVELVPGSYAENITTRGLDLLALKLGDTLKVGTARLRVSKIGKECPRPCAIYYKLGSCIMPREGIFGAVITGGEVRPGDEIATD